MKNLLIENEFYTLNVMIIMPILFLGPFLEPYELINYIIITLIILV